MIVSAKMQDSVEDKLFDLGVEGEFIFFRLPLGLLGGDNDVTEEMLRAALSRQFAIRSKAGRMRSLEFVRFMRER